MHPPCKYLVLAAPGAYDGSHARPTDLPARAEHQALQLLCDTIDGRCSPWCLPASSHRVDNLPPLQASSCEWVAVGLRVGTRGLPHEAFGRNVNTAPEQVVPLAPRHSSSRAGAPLSDQSGRGARSPWSINAGDGDGVTVLSPFCAANI
ncbi:hypothetical protein OH76DRAFT_367146 [Lentinus brumalis]|uniref:Uncharacterized protein n=1 Tax=Lentinus brumalis TaxID=2498619 RepID=A0A371DE57_9APHY|nr:hypothetical protein OH76DRAFT_367146 [Polyporus brumalis]